MKPDNLRKKERLFKQAHKKAAERETKGLFEGAALAYLEASKLLPKKEASEAKALYLDKCGYCYDESGNYELAKEAYKKSLAIKEKFLPSNSISIANSLNDLGVVNEHIGEYKEAKAFLKRALVIREDLLGKEHPDTLQTLNNLSNIYYSSGDFNRSINAYQYILEIQKKTFNNDNLDIALTFYNLGNTYHAQGDFERAHKYCQQSLDIREKIVGTNHKLVADSLSVIGNIYISIENFEMAEKYHARTLNIIEKNLGNEHPSLNVCLNALGTIYSAQDKYQQAEDCYQRAIFIAKKKLGDNHPDIAVYLLNLGVLFSKKGDLDKTEIYYQQAQSIQEKSLDKEDPQKAALFNNLGELYFAKGEYTKAKNYFSRAREIIKKSLLPNHPYNKAIDKNYQDLQQKVANLEREKLEKRAALHKAERLAYLGQMAAMMAHNMNQPIGVIRMTASGALSDVDENLFDSSTELKPLLEKILNQTERLSQIMSNFRNLARSDRTVLSAVNLNEVINYIYQLLFDAQYQLDKIVLLKDLAESPIAHSNEWALQEMLISLLSNAREAVKDKAIKQVGIKTWQQDNQAGFCVEDSGDGIAQENLPKLFTPFLTSKNEGMGLGLYFCREIAKDLGGSIEYYPASLGGAGFKITLPAEQDEK